VEAASCHAIEAGCICQQIKIAAQSASKKLLLLRRVGKQQWRGAAATAGHINIQIKQTVFRYKTTQCVSCFGPPRPAQGDCVALWCMIVAHMNAKPHARSKNKTQMFI
jgi:hypothetical protein